MIAAAPAIAQPRDKLTRQHIGLIVMLAFVVMFEGFDISLTSVVLPYLGKEYDATSAELGKALAIIALGSIAAWFLIRLADRYGRRPILLVATAGFSIGSLLTVLTFDVGSYTFIQFFVRLLMVTQVAIAYLILSETLPPTLRGRANGLLGACGSFGAALPFLLLAPALETAVGWRLLFIIGSAPLLILPVLFFRLHETPVWVDARDAGRARLTVRSEIGLLLAAHLRRRFVAMGLLWFIINFATSVSSLFFTLYVVQERGWLPADFARLAPFGLGGAFLGFIAAGALMDLIGRRWTITLFMALLGSLTQLCYSVSEWWAVAACFVGLQAMLGVWVVGYTVNSELFPTELRAAANGWCHNLIGRWGVVVAPWLLGVLAADRGSVGVAATLLGFVAYLAIPVLWIGLPESRAKKLG